MNIAVVGNNRHKFSETFIQNQVKHLPFETHFFYGSYLPPYYGNETKFIDDSFASQMAYFFRKSIFRQTDAAQLKAKIASYISSNDIKVVLANYALTAIPFLDICKAAQVPLVVHFHGYTAYRNDIYESNRNEYHRLFREVAAIISVSDHMSERLKKLGAPAPKIFRLTCGADESIFSYKIYDRLPKTILYNGRFCDTKNPHLVILAFAELLKQIPDAELVMVGDGELMPGCVNLAKSLSIFDKIKFRGVLQHKDVAEQMRNASALVQFSATTPNNDTEGTPLAVLEAGLSGLPVIASRSGGLPEIIIDNETGYLVNELDLSALVSKMYEALTNHEKSFQIAARLRENVLAKYTLEKYTNQLAALLKAVANSKV